MCFVFFFFFSSRRRHTRSKRDWSSDVCSSDLVDRDRGSSDRQPFRRTAIPIDTIVVADRLPALTVLAGLSLRSEERRGGKEGGARWWGAASRRNSKHSAWC